MWKVINNTSIVTNRGNQFVDHEDTFMSTMSMDTSYA